MSQDQIAAMQKAKELQALKNANKKLITRINLLTNQVDYYKSLANQLQGYLHTCIQTLLKVNILIGLKIIKNRT